MKSETFAREVQKSDSTSEFANVNKLKIVVAMEKYMEVDVPIFSCGVIHVI